VGDVVVVFFFLGVDFSVPSDTPAVTLLRIAAPAACSGFVPGAALPGAASLFVLLDPVAFPMPKATPNAATTAARAIAI
jgi:hypothetical protein